MPPPTSPQVPCGIDLVTSALQKKLIRYNGSPSLLSIAYVRMSARKHFGWQVSVFGENRSLICG